MVGQKTLPSYAAPAGSPIVSSGDKVVMTTELKNALETFRNRPSDRADVAQRLLPLLVEGTPRHEVLALLSSPTSFMWGFALFYSSAMDLWFDEYERLQSIESDVDTLMGSGTMAPDTVAAASEEFKSNPYNRRAPAEILIASIARETPAAEIAPILGKPTRVVLRYKLADYSRTVLDVVFDDEDKVCSAAIR